MPLATRSDSSDSEDDLDYVPPADDHDSDSADERDLGDKSTNGTGEQASPGTDPAEQKKQRDALWASFQASVSALPSTGHADGSRNQHGVGHRPPAVKRVQIEKRYLFAGKHVSELVEVPEDSEEATKWPRWSSRASGSTSISTPTPARISESSPVLALALSPSRSCTSDGGEGMVAGDRPALPALPLPSGADSSSATTTATLTPTLGANRPGPRKPRAALPTIPSKASQPKKITTLDKSAMDWRTHVATESSNIKDELDANRRGGGYLEKVDFLKRVQDRRDNAFEASKPSKRRKA